MTTIVAPIDVEPITDDVLDSFAVIRGDGEEEESSRVLLEERSHRHRRRERSSTRASSSASLRRRRGRVSGATTPTLLTSARLGDTEAEKAQNIFLSHVNLAANALGYVRESDDFFLLSR